MTLQSTTGTAVGAPMSRVEAVEKVTGTARYAAEFHLDRRAYGWIVQATVASGSVRSITVPPLPGVLHLISHENAPRLVDDAVPRDLFEAAPLQHPDVAYRGQPIALLVAETLEQARAAAAAARIDYAERPHDVVLTADHPRMYTPEKLNGNFATATDTGDVETGLAAAAFRVDETYQTPAEHHAQLEPHAATAAWDGGALTVYHSNQGVSWVAPTLAGLFQLDQRDVRVLSDHVGGGFGGKGRADAAAVLAALAARVADRPVTVVATRQQMFDFLGYRTPTIQRVSLGADETGRLTALDHTAYGQTSRVLEFAQRTAAISRSMYRAANARTLHRIVALDVPTPCWMRAPGETPGSFALESAMDELAIAAAMDPVELRIKNDTDRELEAGLRFTSRSLVECLREGAARFGWSERDPAPGVRRDGRWLVGTGVAASNYHASSRPATATATAHPDGGFTVDIAAADIGTGARTVLRQVAADELGTVPDRVHLRIGDNSFGPSWIAGSSMGTASWSWAVWKACRTLRERIATTPDEDVSVRVDTAEDVAAMEAAYARHAFGAQFAEVRVDVDTGEIRVPRMVGVFAAGRIVNPTTARSQIVGAMTMGIGMALHEESITDERFGGFVNHDLASYHIPVNADIAELDVAWIDEVDELVNPLGIKGVGEIGIVGTAAAIANAVWHATGARFRSLPLTPDKVGPALRR
jgi:xanthine dehydrogenase YagR molybdenum-binding subunit